VVTHRHAVSVEWKLIAIAEDGAVDVLFDQGRSVAIFPDLIDAALVADLLRKPPFEKVA
jgi:hypothetical protein